MYADWPLSIGLAYKKGLFPAMDARNDDSVLILVHVSDRKAQIAAGIRKRVEPMNADSPLQGREAFFVLRQHVGIIGLSFIKKRQPFVDDAHYLFHVRNARFPYELPMRFRQFLQLARQHADPDERDEQQLPPSPPRPPLRFDRSNLPCELSPPLFSCCLIAYPLLPKRTISFTASIVDTISDLSVKYPGLARTAPDSYVPAVSCPSGVQ